MNFNFAAIFINRPVLTTVISIVIITFGIMGYSYLGVREFPNVDPPIVTVRTNYVGANADVIESQITEVLEESINGIAGIESISSISTDGRSTITVEFALEVDMEAATNDVRDRVSAAARQLPPDIDPPVVRKADADASAILSMTISSPNYSLLELSDIATNLFKERLQTIPGVSHINIWGDKLYSMKLQMEPEKLAAYGLTPLDVRDALNRENIELPTGRIEGFAKELTIRTSGRLTTEEEFNDIIIQETDGAVVRFKDVGTARLLPENQRSILRGNFAFPQVAIAVSPQPGANHVAIAEEFARRVELIKQEAPDDLSYSMVVDSTAPIVKAIDEVVETIILAFLLVVLVIFLFLRDWRTTMIPVITIPISLIGSFFVMYVMGFSINILTMLAIVLVTGLVVDDAIVVMENIYSKIEKGMDSIQAGYKGTQEIVFAVISTTITLTAVFMPIIFLEGLTGRLFREFGIVVAGAVIISSVVSLTLTPMLSSRFLKFSEKRGRLYRWSERQFEKLGNGYENSLRQFMKYRWVAFIIMAVSVVMIVGFGPQIPSELAPLEDKSALMINATAPEGVSYEKMDEYMKEVMYVLDKLPEKKAALTVTSPSFGSSTSANTGFARVALVEPNERDKSQQQLADELMAEFKDMTFARTFVSQQQTIGDRRGGLPIQYVVQAPNFEKLREQIPEFMSQVNNSPKFSFSDLNLKFNKPELNVEINRDRARALGVTVADIAETLQLYFSGQRYGYFIMGGKQYQVIGEASRENRDEPVDLRKLYVRNNKGQLVQLDNLVTLSERTTPPQLFRYNRYVSATVSADMASGVSLGEGIEEMDRIAGEVFDETFTSTLAGTSKEFMESSNSLMFAFLLALVLVYLVLAAQFESFIDPLIVMFTVPLAVAGALAVLYVSGHTLNIFSQIGIIVLTGIVTKNGILIVEFANQIQARGEGTAEAAVHAAGLRFRPILMTSMATVLGVLPIALALGASAKSRVPMGLVIIGGLIFSLILTLYVIPALYSYMSRKSRNQLKLKNAAIGVGLVMLMLTPTGGFAQDETQPAPVLSLEEAVAIALENNYDIIVARNNAEILANDNTIGNAGFLPTVDAQAGINRSVTNNQLVFFDGREQQATGATSDVIYAGAVLNWTVFDGTRMFLTKKRLAEMEAEGAFQARSEIESTVAEIAMAYYSIVQTAQYVSVLQEAVGLSDVRLEIASAQFQLGSGSELSQLQAEVDRNSDHSILLQQQAVLKKAKAELNRLLAREPDVPFTTVSEIPLVEPEPYDSYAQRLESENPQLLAARSSLRTSELMHREAKAAYSPRVDLFGEFNYSESHNEVGVLQLNRNLGPTYGITATFNIFNGLNQRREVQNQQLNVLTAQANLDAQTQELHTGLFSAYTDYYTFLELVDLETSNVEVARRSVDVATESYRLGAINDIQLREAQINLIETERRLLNAQFMAKSAEIEIFRLTGRF